MYIMHSCLVSHKHEFFFINGTFSKSIIFKVKNIFELDVLKNLIYKTIIMNSNPFAFLIINVKILFNFQKELCYAFGIKTKCLKKTTIVHFQGLSALDMQKQFLFVSSFEHVNFTINKKYFERHYDNPNYYSSLVIFQTYKNICLRRVHSLGWLL